MANFTPTNVDDGNNQVVKLVSGASFDTKTLYFDRALFSFEVDDALPITLVAFDPTTNTRERITIPAGGLSSDMKSATGVKRGIAPNGTDITTENQTYGVNLSRGTHIFPFVSPQLLNQIMQIIGGEMAFSPKFGAAPTWDTTKANVALTPPIYANAIARDAAITAPTEGMIIKNTDTGQNEQYIGGGWIGIGDTGTVNASETVAGKSRLATLAEQGAQSATGVLQAKNTIKNATYTPAFLTGGSNATSVVATWNAVSDGSFTISIDGTEYDITGLDFSLIETMAQAALVIQAGIRAETGGLETCVWSTDHFVISSVNTTSTSAITVTSAVGSGTDISGAGGTDFMDADSGNGTVTDAVANTTENKNKVVVVNEEGKIAPELTDVRKSNLADMAEKSFLSLSGVLPISKTFTALETIDGTTTPKPVHVLKARTDELLLNYLASGASDTQSLRSGYAGAQTFVVPIGSQKLTKVKVRLKRGDITSGELVLTIRRGDPNSTEVLHTENIPYTAIDITATDIVITPSTPIDVVSGETLSVCIAGGTIAGGIGKWVGDSSGFYSDGNRWYSNNYPGTAFTSTSGDLNFDAHFSNDVGILVSDANDALRNNFVGFCAENVAVGETTEIIGVGIFGGFSGLTPGSDYFVSDTLGVLSTTAGTKSIRVGIAISTTELLIGR